ELEEEIIKFNTFELKYSKLDSVKIKYTKLTTDYSDEVLIWLEEMKIKLNDQFKEVKKTERLTIESTNKFRVLQRLLMSLECVIENWGKIEYIVEFSTDSVLISPFKVNTLCND